MLKLYPTEEDMKYRGDISDYRNIILVINEKKKEMSDIMGIKPDDITVQVLI